MKKTTFTVGAQTVENRVLAVSRPHRSVKRKEIFDNSEEPTGSERPASKYKDWNVSSIIDHKLKTDASRFTGMAKFQFYIAWEGYSAADNSWEPFENINSGPIFHEYMLSNGFDLAPQEDQFRTSDQDDERLEQGLIDCLGLVRARKLAQVEFTKNLHVETAFRVTYELCFFDDFMSKLQRFTTTRSHTVEIDDVSGWCPELPFDCFVRCCQDWKLIPVGSVLSTMNSVQISLNALNAPKR